jgi:2-oxoglutarate dehydrogenase complex dehydrogenase (E1) component-like enzyme
VAGAISHLRIVQPAVEASMRALQHRFAADA